MDKRVAFGIAAICGMIFGGSTSYIQCIALLVFPVACTQSTQNSIVSMVLFYSFAAIQSIVVAYSFYSSITFSLMVFGGLVFINAFIFVVAFIQTKIPDYIAIPLAVAFVSLPPIGSVNALTLLPLSGWLFPGFGIYGIALLLILIGLLCSAKRYGLLIYAATAALAFPFGSSQAMPLGNNDTGKVAAINLRRAYDEKLHEGIMRTAYRYEEMDIISVSNTDIAVLPESVFGVWKRTDGEIFKTSSKTIFGGARVYLDNKRYVNVVVDAKTGEVVYEQLNPPRIKTVRGARAVSGRGELIETGIAFMICYEITNSWIVYKSFRDTEKPVVWISNMSWMKSDYLKKRVGSVHEAWARLYSQPRHSAMMTND